MKQNEETNGKNTYHEQGIAWIVTQSNCKKYKSQRL